jgi:hypothetical protein
MTPRVEDVSIDQDVNMEAMFIVPRAVDLPDSLPTLDVWADAAAAELFTPPYAPALMPDTFTAYRAVLLSLADTRAVPDFGDDTPLDLYVHFRYPTPVPLVIGTFLYDAEPFTTDETARVMWALTEAVDERATEAPIVDHLIHPEIGPGLRVLRYRTLPSHGDLAADLRYVWHFPRWDAFFLIRTLFAAPARIIAAMDDLDAYARSVRMSSDGTRA